MSDLLQKLYEKLYSQVGGKPWTELTREDQKRSPLLYMLIFLGFGMLIARLAGKYWWLVLIAFGLGVLVGHLFW